MKCPSCKTKIPEIPEAITFTFCPFCAKSLKVDKSQKVESIKIPEPRQLPSGRWHIALRKEGISITEDTPELCRSKAKLYRSGKLPIEKKEKKDFVSVGKLVDDFIQKNEKRRSPATIRAYKSYRKHHFQELMKLDANSEIDYQKHIDDESEAGNSAKTVINAWRLITAALTAADIEIPSRKIEMPKRIKHEKQFLDYEQISVFLEAIKGNESELVALLALHSLRLSEILALTKDKIDLKKNLIHVRGAVVMGENGLQEKPQNKTEASVRDVPIMIPRLAELLQNCPAGRIVPENRKRPYDQINKTCRDAGLPEVGVHGLRHSFASLAYHLNWSEKTTMKIGGWSNNATVNEVYTHLASSDVNDDVQAMKNFYNGDYNHTVVELRTNGEEQGVASNQ